MVELKFVPPKPRREDSLIWYCIDFDNTIAEGGSYPDFIPQEPIWENIYKLINIYHAGFKIIVWTARHSVDYEMVKEWLEFYKVPFHRIETGKTLARKYIDDKAINASAGSWL